MRAFAFLLAFVLAACGGAQTRHAPSVLSYVRIAGGGGYVSFQAPNWHLTPDWEIPGLKETVIALHWHDHASDEHIIVWVKDAKPGETVKDGVMKFALLLPAVPILFQHPEATPVQVVSEEKALFALRGVDSKRKTSLVALCSVRLLPSRTDDRWVMIIAYGPESQTPKLSLETAAIASTLRIEPASP